MSNENSVAITDVKETLSFNFVFHNVIKYHPLEMESFVIILLNNFALEIESQWQFVNNNSLFNDETMQRHPIYSVSHFIVDTIWQ